MADSDRAGEVAEGGRKEQRGAEWRARGGGAGAG